MIRTSEPGLGRAWLLLCAALALHVFDEALSGFLSVYNPTVQALRLRIPWLPLAPFDFSTWLTGLIVGIVLLFCLSPLAFSNARLLRPIGWFLAVIMLLNALGHIAATLAGRTLPEITFPRPMPGFWSSPFLLAASLYLAIQLKRIKPQANAPPDQP